jgi:hyaluronoglucosaminidase
VIKLSDSFEYKGVVEGFYGKPWTFKERQDIIKFMGKTGYNIYIYGPKADELHRDSWREKYDDEFINEFKKLVDIGKEYDVDVSIAVSPGLSLIHSSEDDLNALYEKYMQFVNIGVNTISLFLDDIPWKLQHEEDIKNYECLAQAQADFTNKIYEKLQKKVENLKFILCPTEYWGKPHVEYHEVLGEKLNRKIDLMWTGPKVCSEYLTVDDAINVSKSFKRKILYWDNYPVNDSVMVPEMHLDGYIKRDKKLYKYSKGIIINPMNQAYASIFSLKNISYYLNNPEKYDEKKHWLKTIKYFAPEICEEFQHFAKYNTKSPINDKDPEIITNLISEFEYLYHKDVEKASLLLKNESEKIENNYQKIKKYLDKNLLKDIEKWLEEYRTISQMLNALSTLVSSYYEIFENAKIENMNKVKSNIKNLEDITLKMVQEETFIGGIELIKTPLKYLKYAKGFIKLVEY